MTMAYQITYLLILLATLPGSFAQVDSTPPYFNFSYGADEFLALYEEQEKRLVITLVEKGPTITNGRLELSSADPKIFGIQSTTDIDIESLGSFPVNITTSVKGIFFGISSLEIHYSDGSDEVGVVVGSYVVKVSTIPSELTPVFSYLTLIWLIISYIMMGSKMTVKDLWSIIKKPWVLLLAMACQFFLMPALAFGLSKAFSLDNNKALGLIMVGSCPGGWLSNIFSLLLDCDFILSLTMTFFSTILAMGMMPFNLWLYALPLTNGDENFGTPYLDLFLQIAYLVIPIGLSMLVARFSSKFRKYCDKFLKPVATMCILIAVSIGVPANLHLYQSASAEEYAVSALLPLGGCIAGLAIAKILCLERRKAVTVSLETGAQNSLLAATMLAFFYPRPEADLIAAIPYIMALFSLCEGIAVTIIYILARYVFCKERFAGKSSDSTVDEEKPGDLEDNMKDIPLEDTIGQKPWSEQECDSTGLTSDSITMKANNSSGDNGQVNTAFTY